MTCIIVEEDTLARANLGRLAATVDDLSIAAEYTSAMEAYQDLQALRVDFCDQRQHCTAEDKTKGRGGRIDDLFPKP